MNPTKFNRRRLSRKHWMARVFKGSVGLCLWCGICLVGRAEESLPEYQVKALFLLNFTKYVDWPPNAFARNDTPITIGLYGENKLGEALKSAVAGKSVGGRAIIVRQIERAEDSGHCQILFISASEAFRVRGILEKTSKLPILTVGEEATFAQCGGIINFVLKNGNVRLEVDLAAAKQAGLTISSRLLAVADVVKGKAN
jgi:hypothetical protein